MGEFLASYLAVAYRSDHPPRPRLAAVHDLLSVGWLRGPKPKHTSLEDFEALYVGVGFQNYGWYQTQIGNRAEAVYRSKKLELLKDVKAAFPEHEAWPVPVDVSLERLEKISPGFLAWARQLEGGGR